MVRAAVCFDNFKVPSLQGSTEEDGDSFYFSITANEDDDKTIYLGGSTSSSSLKWDSLVTAKSTVAVITRMNVYLKVVEFNNFYYSDGADLKVISALALNSWDHSQLVAYGRNLSGASLV